MDIYIIKRRLYLPNAGGSVGLSKGRFDSSKPSVDGTYWPLCLVLSKTRYRNASNAVTGNWLNMHIMAIQQELKA